MLPFDWGDLSSGLKSIIDELFEMIDLIFRPAEKSISLSLLWPEQPGGPCMVDTWVVSLEHMLDENRAIAAPKAPARKLAEHIFSIVAMASRPEIIPCTGIPGSVSSATRSKSMHWNYRSRFRSH